jgi:hypothetical protein
MQYMLLIHTDEPAWLALTDEERREITGEYMSLVEALRVTGQYLDGAPLQPSTVSTTVRVRDGEQLVTDGPFADTKEQLGGFFMVEAETIDEAIEIAAKIPGARYGAIEVRPVAPVPAEAASA